MKHPTPERKPKRSTATKNPTVPAKKPVSSKRKFHEDDEDDKGSSETATCSESESGSDYDENSPPLKSLKKQKVPQVVASKKATNKTKARRTESRSTASIDPPKPSTMAYDKKTKKNETPPLPFSSSRSRGPLAPSPSLNANKDEGDDDDGGWDNEMTNDWRVASVKDY